MRTKFGERLAAIRERIVASGQPLLDWDGVERQRMTESRSMVDTFRDHVIRWNDPESLRRERLSRMEADARAQYDRIMALRESIGKIDVDVAELRLELCDDAH